MKTLMNWGYSLAFVFAFCISCSDADNEQPVDPTPIEVGQDEFNEFFDTYKSFLESLPELEKAQVMQFIESIPEVPDRTGSSRTSVESACRCLANQSSCYARGRFSDCCICWDPVTHVGVCGTYGGFVSCRIERKKTVIIPQPPPVQQSPKITIYPDRMASLFTFIEQNNIASGSQTDLQKVKEMFSQL